MGKLPHSEIERCVSIAFSELREETGLTQEKLAEKAGIGESFVAKTELGERRLHVDELPIICRGLGVDEHQFVDRFLREMQRAEEAAGPGRRDGRRREGRKGR